MKKKLLIVIPIIIVVIVGIVLFFMFNKKDSSISSENSVSNIENILKDADIYNATTFKSEINKNAARAQDLNNKNYVFFGTIDSILTEYVVLKNDYSGTVNVYLESEELKALNKGEQIAVVGLVKDVSLTTGKIEKAKIVEKEILNKYFVIDMTAEKGTRYPNYKYSKYVYDNNGRTIEYSVSGDRNGTYKIQYDNNGNITEKKLETILYGNDITTYEYDENGKLIKETEIDYNKDGSESNKKVFNHDVVLNENGKIIKDSYYNVDSPDFKYEFTYEYDEEKVIKETEHDFHSNGEYSSTFTYDSFDNKISKNTSGTSSNIVKYTYAIVSKK